MWKSMDSAPKDKLINIAYREASLEKEYKNVTQSFFGKVCIDKYDQKFLDDVWVDFTSFDCEMFTYYSYIKNPLCWCEIPNYPTDEELAGLK